MRKFFTSLPLFSCLIFCLSASSTEMSPPALSLANIYHNDIDVKHYWISEKLDGVRAYWTGQQLLTRGGHIIQAPDWFLQQLPRTIRLDGELWIGRGQFEQTSAIVRRQTPDDENWKLISYRVFDIPRTDLTFDQRITIMKDLLNKYPSPHLKMVEQFRVSTHTELRQRLQDYVAQGAEGLMLHRADAYYRAGRSDDLLKLKPYMDAEARVLEHVPGKGKYTGMLGAILVENTDGIQFRIGSGFSDAQRRSPPPLDSIITYKYFGNTRNGTPRFASFLRLRKE